MRESVVSRVTPQEQASDPSAFLSDLQRRFEGAPAKEVLSAVLTEIFPSKVAVVSSFGAESAVLLHLVAEIDPATPVLFIDTRRHFAETLEYRQMVIARLGLACVRDVGPSPEEEARLDAGLNRFAWDPDGCCAFRKVAPLERALAGFAAWVTGRKQFQAPTRQHLPLFELDGRHIKVNPLATWTAADVADHMVRHGLPAHPLVAKGYWSIGCAPCTSAVGIGEHQRDGRWRGSQKIECGIHRPADSTAGEAK